MKKASGKLAFVVIVGTDRLLGDTLARKFDHFRRSCRIDGDLCAHCRNKMDK